MAKGEHKPEARFGEAAAELLNLGKPRDPELF